LLEEGVCCPTSMYENSSASSLDSSMSYRLTHLELVPLAPKEGTRDPTQAMVMATFAILPAPGVLIDMSHQYQQASSIICQWQLQKGLQDKLLPCFEQLNVKKKPIMSATPRVYHFQSIRDRVNTNNYIATRSTGQASGCDFQLPSLDQRLPPQQHHVCFQYE
jgi:hypothetical protein